MKLCLFCRHICYSDSVWYSEETGGDEAYYSCNAGKFTDKETDLDSLRGWSQIAETCTDYELDESIEIGV